MTSLVDHQKPGIHLNTYSVALPVPDFRQDSPDICIEYHYRDEEIKRVDENGRRLFISNEFNPKSDRHKSESFNCIDQNKIKRFTIVDNKVFNDENENVAFSKNAFATNVHNGTPNFNNFDLSAFENLFALIEDIVRSWYFGNHYGICSLILHICQSNLGGDKLIDDGRAKRYPVKRTKHR